ncbi:MAG: UDP-3-O-(3-hydroxymyristoyl)glucosamine N-acyltransferase [Chthoniobacterales bacterium]
MSFTAIQIAEKIQGEVLGDKSTILTGFAAADSAREGDLTFAEKEEHFAVADQSAASAIIVSGDFKSSGKVLIRVPNARIAVARLLPLFFPSEPQPSGIHPSAVIAYSAKIDPCAHVGPNCVIGEGVQIGARSVLLGGNHVGKDATIGEDVSLFPNVVIYSRTVICDRVSIHAGTVIGSDGYGYVLDEGKHRKMLQVGNVVIHNDVEIGSNTSIDRAALGSTVIGAGTKIDNLVHVAHNVVVGRNCLIMGQCGFAGSIRIGDYSVIASQTGIAGHVKIGNQVMIGAKSGIMRDVPDGAILLGVPAVPHQQAKRQFVAMQLLPDMVRRMREAEKQIEKLQAKLDSLS